MGNSTSVKTNNLLPSSLYKLNTETARILIYIANRTYPSNDSQFQFWYEADIRDKEGALADSMVFDSKNTNFFISLYDSVSLLFWV